MASNHPEREHNATVDEENDQSEFIDPNDVLVEMAEDDGVDYPMDDDDEDGEDAAGPSGADIIYEDTSIQRFTNHTNSVFAVAVHPSAKIAVSGGEDDLGYIWDCTTGEELVKLTGHTDSVTNVGFNHDGEMVATGGMDGKVRVWKRVGKEDFKKWTFLTELQGPDEVMWIRWHPKGNVLLAGSNDTTVWLWNLPTQNSLANAIPHPNVLRGRPSQEQINNAAMLVQRTKKDYMTRSITAMRFTSVPEDQRQEYSTVFDNLWKLVIEVDPKMTMYAVLLAEDLVRRLIAMVLTCQQQRTLLSSNPPKYLLELPALKMITGQIQECIDLFNRALAAMNGGNLPQQGNTMQVFAGHVSSVVCGEFTPDGKRIITADADGTLIFWDPRSPTPLWKLTPEDGRFDLDGITSMAVNPASTVAVIGGASGGIRVVNLSKGDIVGALAAHKEGESVEAIAFIGFAGRAEVVVTGSTDGKACVWDLNTLKVRNTLEHGEPVTCLVPLPEPKSHLVVSGSADNALRSWDTRTGTLIKEHRGHRGPVLGAAVGHDGSFVISAGDDGACLVFAAE